MARADWDRFASRVERNTDAVLEIFGAAGIHATFFTLGWVAERHPTLMRRIAAAGHEIASHGYAHVRADEQDRSAFREDVRRTKGILEAVSGQPVSGYRAASFSIGARNFWAFDVLAEEGYRYSSSIYPVVHDHYGMPEAPRFAVQADRTVPLRRSADDHERHVWLNFPCSGGGYFRMLPYGVSTWQLHRVNRRDRQPCIFYFHPWEIDPEQPRLGGVKPAGALPPLPPYPSNSLEASLSG